MSDFFGNLNQVTIFDGALTGALQTSDAASVSGMQNATLFFNYGAVAGGDLIVLNVQYSLDGTNWYSATLYEPDVIVAGSDAVSLAQRETVSYTATAAASELFILGAYNLAKAPDYMRVQFTETAAGVHGDLSIVLVLS